MPTKWFRQAVSKLWSAPTTSVTGAAVIIAAASLASRLLGIFRDRVLAGLFGAGEELDIYYAAFKIPDLIFNLLIVGALSAGFIPVFINLRERKNGEHWYLVNAFLSIVLICLVFCAILLFLFAPQLSHLITPGFDEESKTIVGNMMRIMALSPIVLGLSAILGGILQSYKRFFVYSIAPIFYNVGIIIGALFFVNSLGIYGLAWGVILGAILHLLIQLPAVRALGWKYRCHWSLKDKEVRKVFKLMVPRTLALSITQVNLFFITVIASFLSAGSIAVFNLATNLFFVPVALFGISYAIASFPEFNEALSNDNKKLFMKQLRSVVRMVLFLIIPTTVLYLILRAQIVRVVLGSGAFDWADTVATFEVLYWLSFAMFAHALIPVFVRAFYAAHNTVLPLLAGVVGDVFTIVLSLYLSRDFSVAGLAMAFSLGALVNLTILYFLIQYKFGAVFNRESLQAISAMLFSGFIMAFVAQGVKTGLGTFHGTETFITIFSQAAITTLVAVLAYLALSFLFHSRELVTLITAAKSKLPFKFKGPIDESEGI